MRVPAVKDFPQAWNDLQEAARIPYYLKEVKGFFPPSSLLLPVLFVPFWKKQNSTR